MASGSQEISQIVHALIKKSKLISEGSPAQYCLNTTRSNLDENGLVRKWTFGQRDNNMQNKILLMVGETGTGKTTLINAMVNYILGVKFTDEVWFEITEEGGDKQMSDQSQTQTSEITMYEVFTQDNPMCVTIIDTPGYGDTRGTEYDKQIAENLYKLFHSDTGVKEIDAVCLVVKASDNRLSDRQHYIFDAILSLFGKDIENNIVILITHSDGMAPKNALNAIKKARIPCKKDKKGIPVHFLFNNCQIDERTPEYNEQLQRAWAQTYESLNNFFPFLKEQNRKSLEQTESVMIKHKQIKECITNLQRRIEYMEGTQEELAQIQKALEENREKIKQNENFTFTVTKSYKEKVDTENDSWWNRMVTRCDVCQENCHEYNCWCAWNASWCYMMKNGHCTVCTGKCHYSKHVRENKKYATLSKEITMTYDDIKQQYDNNDSASDIKFDSKEFEYIQKDVASNRKQEEVKTSIETRLKEELTKTEEEKTKLVEEAYNIIRNLFEIALKSDSAFIIKCLDFFILRADETGKGDLAEKLRELREIPPESQERVHAVMGYLRRGVSKVKDAVTGNSGD